MAPRTNRLERITNLLLALLETNRPLSLREIGSSVAGYPAEAGALRQAFERDKRTLRDEGIPITTERIDGDDQVGYRILPEQYYLPDLQLTPDEHQALSFALAAVRLDAGVSRDVGAKFAVSPSGDVPPVVVLPALSSLGTLQEAIRTRSPVEFSYRARQRSVVGYGLAFKEGSWYFIGRQDDGDLEAAPSGADVAALRTFRVDRFETEPVLGPPHSYEVPADFDLSAALRFFPFASAGDAPMVTIDVDVREARRVNEVVGLDSRIDGAPAGSVRLRFAVGDREAFASWMLGLGDAAQVLEPVDIRSAVIERLRDIVAAGSGNSRDVRP